MGRTTGTYVGELIPNTSSSFGQNNSTKFPKQQHPTNLPPSWTFPILFNEVDLKKKHNK